MPRAKKTKEEVIIVERDKDAIECLCGGYMERVRDLTAAEERKYGCGRPGCCSRAFKCKVCERRVLAYANAPEME